MGFHRSCLSYRITIFFGIYCSRYTTIFGIISATLSAPYDKRPLEAVIVLFIFVGKFTILFFSCFFSKLGNRTAYHSTTAYHSNTAYHSTTAYRSNVKNNMSSSFPGVFAYHSTTAYRSNIQKNTVVEFSRSVRLSFDDRLSFEHTKKNSCRVFQGCSLIIRRPLVFRTYQKTLWS